MSGFAIAVLHNVPGTSFTSLMKILPIRMPHQFHHCYAWRHKHHIQKTVYNFHGVCGTRNKYNINYLSKLFHQRQALYGNYALIVSGDNYISVRQLYVKNHQVSM